MIEMNTSKYLDILNEDVDAWNELVRNNPDMVPDLRGVDLSDADLNGVNFNNVILDNADLGGAALCGSTLIGASLACANLSGADLSESDLSHADLTGANLRGAFLQDANLHRVNLTRADLYKATLKHTSLLDANFQNSNLASADLSAAVLNGACFQNAILSGADLTGSDLTGACILFHDDQKENTDSNTISHDTVQALIYNPGWIIDGVSCDYIYLDTLKQRRCPLDRNFEPLEFEHAFCQGSILEYDFENSVNWFDPLILQQIVSDLNRENEMMGLELLSVSHRRNRHRAIFSFKTKKSSNDILSQIHIRHADLIEKIGHIENYLDMFLKHADLHL